MQHVLRKVRRGFFCDVALHRQSCHLCSQPGNLRLLGTSTAQAARSDVALVIGGPMVAPASNLLLGSRDALGETPR